MKLLQGSITQVEHSSVAAEMGNGAHCIRDWEQLHVMCLKWGKKSNSD